jgi:hypothetical protein
MLRRHIAPLLLLVLVVSLGLAACAKKKPPIARATPPPPSSGAPSGTPPAPPEPVVEPPPVSVPPEPNVESSDLASRSLDEINKQSPLQPVFYEFDSAEMSADAQAALTKNAEILKTNATWVGPPSTTLRSASGGRWRRAPISSHSAFRPTGCAR